MPINFSFQGSNNGNPTQGLSGNSRFQPQVGRARGLFNGQQTPPPVPPTPQPVTPVKSTNVTHPDGTSVTHNFATPDTNTSKPSSGTTPGLITPPVSTPGAVTPSSGQPQVGTPTQNAQNVLNQSNLNSNPEYQQLASQQNALVRSQMLGSQSPFAGQNQSLGQSQADLARPQTTANLSGELANFNNQSSQALSGNAAEASRLISGGQLATGGAENVLGASLLTPTAYGQTNTSGLTGVQDAGQFGSGPGAASNVQTVKDNTSKIGAINSTLPAALAAFDVLNSAAKGIGTDTPIISGLTQLYGSTAQGNQAVASFKAQLQTVRNQYDSILGGGSEQAIPDNITPAQINQVKQQLQSAAQNQITNFQNANNQLSSQGGSSGGSTGGSMFGSFFGQ